MDPKTQKAIDALEAARKGPVSTAIQQIIDELPTRQWPSAFELSLLAHHIASKKAEVAWKPVEVESCFDGALTLWQNAEHYLDEQKFTARKEQSH